MLYEGPGLHPLVLYTMETSTKAETTRRSKPCNVTIVSKVTGETQEDIATLVVDDFRTSNVSMASTLNGVRLRDILREKTISLNSSWLVNMPAGRGKWKWSMRGDSPRLWDASRELIAVCSRSRSGQVTLEVDRSIVDSRDEQPEVLDFIIVSFLVINTVVARMLRHIPDAGLHP